MYVYICIGYDALPVVTLWPSRLLSRALVYILCLYAWVYVHIYLCKHVIYLIYRLIKKQRHYLIKGIKKKKKKWRMKRSVNETILTKLVGLDVVPTGYKKCFFYSQPGLDHTNSWSLSLLLCLNQIYGLINVLCS